MRHSPNSRRWRIALTATALLLALATFVSCGKSGGTKKEGKTVIGFSQMSTDNTWRVAETKSMKDEAAKRADKYELIYSDAGADTARQIKDVEGMIARRVNAIFLAPREAQVFGPALKAARDARIPVFLIDREVDGEPGRDFVTFIGSNFVEEGRRTGEWLMRQTKGQAGIVELLGTPNSSVARDRHDGFAAAIKNSPDMKILTSQSGNFTRAGGQSAMEGMIEEYGRQITAIYSHSDEMALGAIQALKNAGMRPGADVLVVSVDGQRAALEAIRRGEMNVTVECNPRFGPIAFDTLEKFLAGKQVPPKIIVPDRFFDAGNAAQFVGEAY